MLIDVGSSQTERAARRMVHTWVIRRSTYYGCAVLLCRASCVRHRSDVSGRPQSPSEFFHQLSCVKFASKAFSKVSPDSGRLAAPWNSDDKTKLSMIGKYIRIKYKDRRRSNPLWDVPCTQFLQVIVETIWIIRIRPAHWREWPDEEQVDILFLADESDTN